MASELQVTTLRGVPSGANANQIIIPSDQTLAAPGHIIQVQSGVKRDAMAHTGATWTDIGLSVTITPKQSNSHITIDAAIAIVSDETSISSLRMLRDTTVVLPDNPTSPGSRTAAMYDNYQPSNGYGIKSNGFTFVDTARPAGTTAITYKFQVRSHGNGYTFINRSSTDNDASNFARSTSHIRVMEIAQ